LLVVVLKTRTQVETGGATCCLEVVGPIDWRANEYVVVELADGAA
jgi:hypothetical protein